MFRFLNKNIVKAAVLFNAYLLTTWHPKYSFNQPKPQDNLVKTINQNTKMSLLKDIKKKQLCNSTDIVEGKVYTFTIDDGEGNPYKIIVIRYRDKLYALSGTCTYVDPFNPEIRYSLENAICFNDKLLCPFTGSAFDIKTGNVEYGPAMENLPKFFVEQKRGVVSVYYPSKIPFKVLPKTQGRNENDLRKVVIVGGDDNAVMGCIDGLTQYDYTGQISVISDEIQYPYRKEFLHKTIPNFKSQLNINSANEGNLKQYQKIIDKMLDETVYNKLQFRSIEWYKQHGIDFIMTQEPFRVISKRFYPYLSFNNGLKVQYDGLLMAAGVDSIFPNIKGIRSQNNRLPRNVFAPFLNKNQHRKLIKFLNLNNIKSLMIFGLNNDSLQFCQSLIKSFPQIKVKILDFNPTTKIQEQHGPYIMQQILKQYTQRGVQFYTQISEWQDLTNTVQQGAKKSLENSIKITFQQGKNYVEGDCAVLFSNNFFAKTEGIKNAKFADLDFTKFDRLIVDPYCRSDSKRIFGAGMSTSLQFFFTKTRYESLNPLVSYQQGLTSAFNIMALNVPYHYIGFQKRKFFNKQILFAGTQNASVETYYILGSIPDWDFICLYGNDVQITGVSASPSRQRQFQIIRQSFRLNCTPLIEQFANQIWTIPRLQDLIKHLNKSGCYRQAIHLLENKENIGDIIWIQRSTQGFSNDHPNQEDNSDVEIDEKGYIREL